MLVLIVLAILGGVYAWLVTSKHQSEAEARAFAAEAGTRLAFQFDRKFLDTHIAPDKQTHYPVSFRDRLLDRLRGLGIPAGPVDVDGDVTFTSQFFQPVGQFRVRLNYSAAPAFLYLTVSHPHEWWQIDTINLTWNKPPVEPAAALSEAP